LAALVPPSRFTSSVGGGSAFYVRPRERMKITRFAACFLFAVLVCSFGCTASKPTPDPLTGFHAAHKSLDQSIVNDYLNYMQHLSSKEKQNLGPSPVSFFEDGTGQNAVTIVIGMDGNVWEHVLIYDKDDKRVKTFKYVSGDYRS